jgi:hypothetical protein
MSTLAASFSSKYRIILAGTPAITTLLGKLLLTTAPAPTTTLSPSVIPGQIVAFALIQTLFPIEIGNASSFL